LGTFLGKLGLSILDVLGYVPAGKPGAGLLFDVNSTAYECHSVIVTTLFAFEDWTRILGSERLTGAARDRRTHLYHVLESKRESYRMQDAKRRRGTAQKTELNLTIRTKKGIGTGRHTHQSIGSVQDLFKRSLQNLAVRRVAY
jgi:hypothetical protein